jgi:hypothetical protein
MSYGHDDTGWRGLSDADVEYEHLAQKIVADVIGFLRVISSYRITAIQRLRRGADYSSVRHDEILAFANALESEDVPIEDIIHDYAPDKTGWDEKIREAREE